MRNSILEELEQNGYFVLEDFLTPDEIKELHEAGKTLCQEAPQDERKIFSSLKKSQSTENYFLESGDKVRYFFEEGALDDKGELLVDPIYALNKVGHALHTDIPAFSNISFSDRVKELCWQLGYRKPVIPQSMYIYKNPRIGGEVVPHQDASYLHTEPSTALGFWIALEDSTIQNGCLQFIRGSHRSGVHRRYIRNPDKSSPELMIYDKQSCTYPESQFTKVPVSKGTCILIHGHVVHKSDHNRSKDSRHAYTFHVVETHNTKYSEENWLQPPVDKPFPVLYEKED